MNRQLQEGRREGKLLSFPFQILTEDQAGNSSAEPGLLVMGAPVLVMEGVLVTAPEEWWTGRVPGSSSGW